MKRLPLAQVMILGSWDRALHWAPGSAGSLLVLLPLPAAPPTCVLSLSNTFFKKPWDGFKGQLRRHLFAKPGQSPSLLGGFQCLSVGGGQGDPAQQCPGARATSTPTGASSWAEVGALLRMRRKVSLLAPFFKTEC